MRVIEVCVGSSCHLKGAYDVITELQHLILEYGLEEQVELKACFCMNNCKDGVNIRLDDEIFPAISKENITRFFTAHVIN